jgi:hypothetical protein
MVEINHEEMRWLVEQAREKGDSVFIAGQSGIGKTEEIWRGARRRADTLKREFVLWGDLSLEQKEQMANDDTVVAKYYIGADFRASAMAPEDFSGLPDFSSGRYVDFKPMLFAKVMSQPSAEGIAFFDEINQGSRDTQRSLFKVILDRKIGDVKLNDGVLVIGAGNRVEDGGDINTMSPPLATRFVHYTLRCPTADEFIEYNLNSPYPNAAICGFLKSYRDQIHTFNRQSKDPAFANPRSIQRLAKNIKDLPMVTDTDMHKIQLLSSGSCGETWALKFVAFTKMSRKVDVDSILAEPESVKEYIDQLDLKYSIISTIAYRCRENFTKTIDSALMVFNYLDEESGVFALRVCKLYVGEAKLKNYLKKSKIWDEHLSVRFGNLFVFSEE